MVKVERQIKEVDVPVQREEYSQQQLQPTQQQQQQHSQAQPQQQQPHAQVQQQQQQQVTTTKYLPQQYIEAAHGTIQWRHSREIYHGVMHNNPDQMVIYSMNPVQHIQQQQQQPQQQEAAPPHAPATAAGAVATHQHVIQAAEYPTDVSFAVNIVSQ